MQSPKLIFTTLKNCWNRLKTCLPFLVFGEILGLSPLTWRNFAKPYFMHHWTSHQRWLGRKAPPPTSFNIGQIVWQKWLANYFHVPVNTFHAHLKSMLRLMIHKSLAEKPTPPQQPNKEKGKMFRLGLYISCMTKQGKILDWIYTFHAISSNFGSAGRKVPPWPNRENLLDWIYTFHAISSNFGSAGRKVTQGKRGKTFLEMDLYISHNFWQLWFSWQKSSPHFCLFMRDLVCVTHVEYPWSPYYKSTSLGYQLYQLFKILTYREVQHTGSWCRWKAYR